MFFIFLRDIARRLLARERECEHESPARVSESESESIYYERDSVILPLL